MPSLQHQVLAVVVPRLRGGRELTDQERLRRDLLAEQEAASTSAPRRAPRGLEIRELEDNGFGVHELRPAGTTPARTLLFLHGGGYVAHLDPAHRRFAARVARGTGMRVVLPSYPVAPAHTWRDSRPALLELFEQLAIESPQGVVLGGDSAGGGLALALAQQVAGRPGPQPTELVLVSPWVDLTNGVAGTAEAARRDPWLKLSRLRLFGGWWAGDDDLARPELSPVNGDLTRLPPAVMWCGTRDLMQPQCRLLAERAQRQGWDLRYVEEPGLVHDYPLMPIPEARRAWAELTDFLERR